MKLFIDTSSAKELHIKLGDREIVSEAKQNASQMLLPQIVAELEKQNKTLKDITAIEVVTKNGSFTGLRVGVSVAQALAWGLQIPVNGKDIDTAKFLEIEYAQV